MNLIDNLSDDADQLTTIQLSDGSSLVLEFIYRAGTQRWTINVTHPTLTVKNINLVLAPNILRAWRGLIAFGLAITSTDGVDPMNIDDFSTGRVQAYVLDSVEVLLVEVELLGATT